MSNPTRAPPKLAPRMMNLQTNTNGNNINKRACTPHPRSRRVFDPTTDDMTTLAMVLILASLMISSYTDCGHITSQVSIISHKLRS